jgi:hypothetical protein
LGKTALPSGEERAMKTKAPAKIKPKLVKRGKWYEIVTPKFRSYQEEAEWWDRLDFSEVWDKLRPVRLVPGRMPPCEVCGTPMRGRVKPVPLFGGKITLNAVSHFYCPKCKVERLREEGRREVEAVIKALKGLWGEKGKKGSDRKCR